MLLASSKMRLIVRGGTSAVSPETEMQSAELAEFGSASSRRHSPSEMTLTLLDLERKQQVVQTLV